MVVGAYRPGERLLVTFWGREIEVEVIGGCQVWDGDGWVASEAGWVRVLLNGVELVLPPSMPARKFKKG